MAPRTSSSFPGQTIISVIFLILLPVLVSSIPVEDSDQRSIESLGEINREMFFEDTLTDEEPRHRQKRMVFSPKCRGVYDRKLFKQLDRVCDDCHNVFRASRVALPCRKDCFTGKIFEECLIGLQYKNKEKYLAIAKKLRSWH